MGYIELRIRDEGRDILVYVFKSISEAAEMMHFLDGMLPGASFLVQPVMH